MSPESERIVYRFRELLRAYRDRSSIGSIAARPRATPTASTQARGDASPAGRRPARRVRRAG